MNTTQFKRALTTAFDDSLSVERDPKDLCLVVWDVTKKGDRYPAHKCAVGHDNPAFDGIPREPTMTDIDRLRSKNWAGRVRQFGGSKVARKQFTKQYLRDNYEDPKKKAWEKTEAAIADQVKHQITPWAEWRTKVHTTVSMDPTLKQQGTGDRRSRDGIERFKKKHGLSSPKVSVPT